MSGRTPGPWAQHPSFPWIIKQDMQPIAEPADCVTVCNTTAHESSGFFPTPEEGRANARLIAAAPDMLESLLMLRTLIGRPGLALDGENISRVVAAMHSAINKATGGQS